MDTKNLMQLGLFSDGELDGVGEMTPKQIAHKMYRIQEELRVGQWDYDRLLPEKGEWEKKVVRWRGVTSFNFPQWKQEALESRAIIRFLNNWESRKLTLEDSLDQLAFLIQGKL